MSTVFSQSLSSVENNADARNGQVAATSMHACEKGNCFTAVAWYGGSGWGDHAEGGQHRSVIGCRSIDHIEVNRLGGWPTDTIIVIC